jgi:hypothetical protein
MWLAQQAVDSALVHLMGCARYAIAVWPTGTVV